MASRLCDESEAGQGEHYDLDAYECERQKCRELIAVRGLLARKGWSSGALA